MPHTLPKGKGDTMKPLVTMSALCLSLFLVACDQEIAPTTSVTTQDSDVQGEVMDTTTTPAVKAAVVAGIFQNRVHFPPLVIPTDTNTEGDISTVKLDTPSSDVGEEIDLGPPLEEVSPPPDVEEVPASNIFPQISDEICERIADFAGQLEGEEPYWSADWHVPGCTTTATQIEPLEELGWIKAHLEPDEGNSETTVVCRVFETQYEDHPCAKQYRQVVIPEIYSKIPDPAIWGPASLLEYSTPSNYATPTTTEQLRKRMVEALKLKKLLPLFSDEATVAIDEIGPSEKGGTIYKITISQKMLGVWTGYAIVPSSGDISGVVLAIHGHEIGGFMGQEGLMNWLKGFGMDEYQKEGIVVVLMASRPYMIFDNPGGTSAESLLSTDLWNVGRIPLAGLLVIEHLFEIEALKSLTWQDKEGAERTTAGAPIVVVGHSGGGHIARIMGVVAFDFITGVIADYVFSPMNPEPNVKLPNGTVVKDGTHCEVIIGAGEGMNQGMNNPKTFPRQMLFASDKEYYFHPMMSLADHFIPAWELAMRLEALRFMFGKKSMPDIPDIIPAPAH